MNKKYVLLELTVISPGFGKWMMFVSQPHEDAHDKDALFLTTDAKSAMRFTDALEAYDWLKSHDVTQDTGLKPREYELHDNDLMPLGTVDRLVELISTAPLLVENDDPDPPPIY